MKKILANMAAALAIALAMPLAAQTVSDSITRNPLDNLVIRTAVKQSMFPEERVYLHFDNTAYYLTETMWFKAYVMSGEKNEPTTISRVLYVELVAPEGYVVQTKKYRIGDDGTCNGEFELNPLLLSGYYEIRAYTRYMLNRGKDALFSRVFPVFDKVNKDNWDFMNMLDRRRAFLADKDADSKAEGLEREFRWIDGKTARMELKFYPEGGHLVEGIESTVAYELRGKDGINSNRAISILAGKDTIATLTPEFMGMGTFRLKPAEGRTYTAVVAEGLYKETFALPEVEKEGAVIEVKDMQGMVNIGVNHNIKESGEMGLAVLHRGGVRFYERFSAADSSMLFFIDKNTLSEGVNRAVLFVNDSIPLAERMFFVTHDRLLADDSETAKLIVTTNGAAVDSLTAAAHEKIALTIEREDGKPIGEGSFSVSVSNAGCRPQTSYTYNMYTYMLLGSEIKGYIPDAARYFDPGNGNRKRELDIVMLTHGWTAYDWKRLSQRDARLLQPIEKGIMVKGNFVKKAPIRKFGMMNELEVSNRPNTEVTFSIGYCDSMLQDYRFTTGEEGDFRILTEDFYGKRVAKLIPRIRYVKPKDSTFSFVLDRYFSPQMRLYHYWERNLGMPATEEELKSSGNAEMVKTSSFEYLLSQVEVVSKRKREHNYRPPRSEMRFDFLDEWEYALDVTYKTNRADSWSRLYTEHQEYHNYFPQGGNHGGDNLSRLDRQVMPQGWLSDNGPHSEIEMGSSFGMNEHGFHINDPAFYNILSAADILRSAFWRHNLDWCYWVHSMVVMGEYSPYSIPAPDEEYLKGIEPEKMLNFKEIIIRSDENTRKQFKRGHYDKNITGKSKGKYNYSSFYTSFKNCMGIPPREWNSYGTGERDAFARRSNYNTFEDIPNYVACFVPNSPEDMERQQIPLLSKSSSTRYTMVYGYNESKQFYSPDYSMALPDSTTGDYRRTLLWTPTVTVTDGKITLEFYNSSSAGRIAVDAEGYAGGVFYSNNGNMSTNETSREEKLMAESRDAQTPIAGIHDPQLLVHSFKINEEGRTLYREREYGKAFIKFSEAATLGYSDAMFNTAVCYLEGKGTERDSVSAFRLFRKAANMEHTEAIHNLASCYMTGTGTARNPEIAAQLYRKAAIQGFALSQTMIANCYLKGNGVQQDSTEAEAWFTKAAESNEPNALYVMAERLAKADSMTQMSKRKLRKQPAIEYYRRAAEGGNVLAQYKLAQFHESGYYVKKSRKKAFKWYLQAANKLHPKAMEHVAVCYEKGRGTKKDEYEAARWYSMAEKYGSELAKRKMEWYNIFRFFEE